MLLEHFPRGKNSMPKKKSFGDNLFALRINLWQQW